MSKKALAGVVLTVASAMAWAGSGTTVDFSNGQQGWSSGPTYDGYDGEWVDSSLGSSPALHTINPSTFGMNWINSSNPAFTGNYGANASVTLGIDVLANSIVYDNHEVNRNLVVELRDYDNAYGGMPYTSVWYKLGEIGADKGGWQHFSVTIGDTLSSVLPSGWGGYGDTGSVGLPPGRSFADVLAGVDAIAFTTFEPGYFYGYTGF